MTKIQEHSRNLHKRMLQAVRFFRRQEYVYGIRWMRELLEEEQQLLSMLVEDSAWMARVGADAESLVAALQNIIAAQQNQDYILLADLLEMQMIPFLRRILVASAGQEPEWDFERFMENFRWLRRENPTLAQEVFGADAAEWGDAVENAAEGDAGSGGIGEGNVERDSLRAAWQRRREELSGKGYVPEYSEDGNVIMSCEDAGGRFYFHTNTDVVQESQMLAQSWFHEKNFMFALYGLGLGHHIEALLDLQRNISVDVYEGNMDVVFMACCFSDMSRWDGIRVQVHIDRDLRRFSEQIQETVQMAGAETVIHAPSMRALQNPELRNLLQDYFMQFTSARTETPMLLGNFYRNESLRSPSVWELREEFAGRDVYVVAAGPSLDKNVEGLRGIPEDARILATGTVLKKLLNLGIRPHYVIIIDGGIDTYRQVDGVCGCGVPLLYMATVIHDIVRDYQAEKYVIYQEGFEASERAAAERGVKTMQTGGSVSTTALDLLLQFEARRVIYLGLDLAYEGGMAHCEDTAGRRVAENTDVLMVDGVHGGKVPAGRNLNAYRKWLERRLAQGVGDTEVIDATEGGADVRGMINKRLRDVCQ